MNDMERWSEFLNERQKAMREFRRRKGMVTLKSDLERMYGPDWKDRHPGPWTGEPDFWQAWDGDFHVLARRHPGIGAWCCYVGVPRSSRWYGYSGEWVMTQLDTPEITFSGKGKRMIEREFRRERWYFGIDFMHARDEMPLTMLMRPLLEAYDPKLKDLGEKLDKWADESPNPLIFRPTYKTLPYVIQVARDLSEILRGGSRE